MASLSFPKQRRTVRDQGNPWALKVRCLLVLPIRPCFLEGTTEQCSLRQQASAFDRSGTRRTQLRTCLRMHLNDVCRKTARTIARWMASICLLRPVNWLQCSIGRFDKRQPREEMPDVSRDYLGTCLYQFGCVVIVCGEQALVGYSTVLVCSCQW